MKNRNDKNTNLGKNKRIEFLSKRNFLKKTLSGVVLLPYVVPLIESFNIIAESAEPKSTGRGKGVRVARGKTRITPPGRGRGQNNDKKSKK